MPSYYVVGYHRGVEFTLTRSPDEEQVWEIYAIIADVTEPPEFAGKVLTIHHDGVLASGYPTNLFVIGRRYELDVLATNIGSFNFQECSLFQHRKELGQK